MQPLSAPILSCWCIALQQAATTLAAVESRHSLRCLLKTRLSQGAADSVHKGSCKDVSLPPFLHHTLMLLSSIHVATDVRSRFPTDALSDTHVCLSSIGITVFAAGTSSNSNRLSVRSHSARVLPIAEYNSAFSPTHTPEVAPTGTPSATPNAQTHRSFTQYLNSPNMAVLARSRTSVTPLQVTGFPTSTDIEDGTQATLERGQSHIRAERSPRPLPRCESC